MFSELASCGYPPRDLLHHPKFVDLNLALVERLAGAVDRRASRSWSAPRCATPRRRGRRCSTPPCCAARGASTRSVTSRSCPPTTSSTRTGTSSRPPRSRPSMLDGVSLGVTVCEDVWNDRDLWPTPPYHRDPVEELAAAGADLFINISASPVHRGQGRRAAPADPQGGRRARPVLLLRQPGRRQRRDRLRWSLDWHRAGWQRRSSAPPSSPRTSSWWTCPSRGGSRRCRSCATWRPAVEEAVWQALVLGLRDYASQVRLLARPCWACRAGSTRRSPRALAVEALGRENVHGRRHAVAVFVGRQPRGCRRAGATSRDRLPRDCRSTASTRRSSTRWRRPSRAVTPDTTEENLQARARGAVLMALSNKFGSLLLTTGNKSELAVGYCTLYGDMAGGLAVISDVPKTLVYRLARYINRDREVIPASTHRQAAERRAAAGPEGQRQPAALRRARPHHPGLRRGRSRRRRHRRARPRPRHGVARGPRSSMAASTSGVRRPRHQDFVEGVRRGAPVPYRGRLPRAARVAGCAPASRTWRTRAPRARRMPLIVPSPTGVSSRDQPVLRHVASGPPRAGRRSPCCRPQASRRSS